MRRKTIKIHGKVYRIVRWKNKPLKGRIGEIRIWTRALTQEQIRELYNQEDFIRTT